MRERKRNERERRERKREREKERERRESETYQDSTLLRQSNYDMQSGSNQSEKTASSINVDAAWVAHKGCLTSLGIDQ